MASGKIFAVSLLLGQVAALKTGCASCDCDLDGVIITGSGVATQVVDTLRRGCAVHIPNKNAFCYTHPDCAFAGAAMSSAFQGVKYFDCDPFTAKVSDCNTRPPTLAPTLIPSCQADTEWPTTTAGVTASLACPAGQTGGPKTRVCGATGQWATASNSCVMAATCSDNIQNQGETGIDCGGPCTKTCLFCTGLQCNAPNGVCNEAMKKCDCSNGYTGVSCQEPPNFNMCQTVSCGAQGTCDMTTGVCVCINGYSGTNCQTPATATCIDGISNGGELGVDCGPVCKDECGYYDWQVGEWGGCSMTCGGGLQQRVVKCVYFNNTGAIEAPGKCDESRHYQATIRSCSTDACGAYTWVVGAWEPCTQNCGTGGTQSRTMSCQTELGPAPEAKCGTAPVSTKACDTMATCAANYWAAGTWTACSADCGSGSQTRIVRCKGADGSNKTDGDCTGTMSPGTRACNVEACHSYRWVACGWDDCTATCVAAASGMIGVTNRDVFCRNEQGKVSDPAWCNTAVKPSVEAQGCRSNLCMDYNWMADSKWGPCVNGQQKRTFHCHAPDGLNAGPSECEAAKITLPPATRSCVLVTCPSSTGSDGGVQANGAARPLPGLLAAIIAVFGLSSVFGSTRHIAVVAMFALVLAAVPVSAGKIGQEHLQPHHLEDVKEFLLKSLAPADFAHPKKSESGHLSPFPHKLAVSFVIGDEKFVFDVELIQNLFDQGFKWTTEEGHQNIEPEIRSYNGQGNGSLATVTVYDWDKIVAVIHSGNDAITILPADRVDVDLGDRKGKMFAFRHSSVSQNVDAKVETVDMSTRRKLLQDTNFVGITQFKCADTTNKGALRTLRIGMAADPGFVAQAGGVTQATNQMQELLSVANNVYVYQLGTRLKMSDSQLTTTNGSPASWSMTPVSTGGKCGGSISTQLDALRSWVSSASKATNVGMWHLMTNCWPPPGTVGLAYVGVLCDPSGYSTGVSTFSYNTWLTVAHEMGHNFGAPHSFDNGQGTTGGIMDYGNGKTITGNNQGQTGGVTQFNKLGETVMCAEITNTYAAAPQGKCWDAGDTAGGSPTNPPTAVPTAPPTTCTATADQYGNCPMWASLGSQCTAATTGVWMKANCGASCCTANSAVQQCLSFVPDCHECDIDAGVCLACGVGKSLSPRKDKCLSQCGHVSLTNKEGQLSANSYLFFRVSVADTAKDQILAMGTLGTRSFTWSIKESVATFKLDWLSVVSPALPDGSVELGLSTLNDLLEQDIAYERVPGLIFPDLDSNGKDLSGATLSITSSDASLQILECRP